MSKEKIKISYYETFGKGQNPNLAESHIIPNEPKSIEEIISDYISSDEPGYNDFIQGKTNTISFENYGGEWDDMTGGYFVRQTYEEVIEELDEQIRECQKEKAIMARKFGIKKKKEDKRCAGSDS